MALAGIPGIEICARQDALAVVAYVIHELDGADDRIVDAGLTQVDFDLALAVEMRDAGVRIGAGD